MLDLYQVGPVIAYNQLVQGTWPVTVQWYDGVEGGNITALNIYHHGNYNIDPNLSLERVPTTHPQRKSWDGSWVIVPFLSSSTINMRRSRKSSSKLSINRTRGYLAWTSNRVHIVNSRRSRRYAPRHTRNMVTLAEIALAVILVTPYIVTVDYPK